MAKGWSIHVERCHVCEHPVSAMSPKDLIAALQDHTRYSDRCR